MQKATCHNEKGTTMSKSTSTAKSTLEQLAEKADKNTQARFAEQAAEGVVNPIVLAKLVGVRPQMVYNYLAKGKFTEVEGAVGTNSTQKKVIQLDEANTWAQGYIDRKVTRETKEAEKVAAELAGTTA
jgi:hypothetical protein